MAAGDRDAVRTKVRPHTDSIKSSSHQPCRRVRVGSGTGLRYVRSESLLVREGPTHCTHSQCKGTSFYRVSLLPPAGLPCPVPLHSAELHLVHPGQVVELPQVLHLALRCHLTLDPPRCPPDPTERPLLECPGAFLGPLRVRSLSSMV